MADLYSVLLRLGLAQYFDKFSGEGFETWEIVLDITESDLDALGVKLGHRRILQREIALTRGGSMDRSIQPRKSDAFHDNRVRGPIESNRIESSSGNSTVSKRKYRRHPKNDENAPEKPPSAYVIFSNRLREELKPENLSFANIAKRVGERWQDLSTDEKEPYESEAASAKKKYHTEMAEYKTSQSYREYQQYLVEFKAKQSSTIDEKRPRLSQEESTASSGSIGSHPTESSDLLLEIPECKQWRTDLTVPPVPRSAISMSSPASIGSGASGSSGGIPSIIPLGNTSPMSPLPATLSLRGDYIPSALPQSIRHIGPSIEIFAERTMGSPQKPLSCLPYKGKDSQHPQTQGPFPGPLDYGQLRCRTSPSSFTRQSNCVEPLPHPNTSDSSPKSSIDSTLSSVSTANSSLNPSMEIEERRKSATPILPRVPLTICSSGVTHAATDLVITDRIPDTFPTPLEGSSQPSCDPASSTDVPGERRSLKHLTLQQEHLYFVDAPTVAQRLPEPRHPPHIPQLPSLPSLPPHNFQQNILQPNADPLSILAFAGRLVGRDNRTPPC